MLGVPRHKAVWGGLSAWCDGARGSVTRRNGGCDGATGVWALQRSTRRAETLQCRLEQRIIVGREGTRALQHCSDTVTGGD